MPSKMPRYQPEHFEQVENPQVSEHPSRTTEQSTVLKVLYIRNTERMCILCIRHSCGKTEHYSRSQFVLISIVKVLIHAGHLRHSWHSGYSAIFLYQFTFEASS